MNIEVLYFEGCPNHLPAIEMVRETLKSLGRQDEIHQVEVHTQADAEAVAFVGSPSIRINGADIEPWARTAKAFGLSCRTYLDGSCRCGFGVVLRKKTDIPSCAPLQTRRSLCTAASAPHLQVSVLELRDSSARSACLSIRCSVLLLNSQTKGICYDQTEIRHCGDLPCRSFCSRLGSIEDRDPERTRNDLSGLSHHDQEGLKQSQRSIQSRGVV